MVTRKSLVLFTLLVLIVALFTYSKASAVIVNGSCSPDESAKGECAQLGPNFTLEIVPTTDGQFPFTANCNGVKCTVFPYFLNNPVGNNQLNFLVPRGFIPPQFLSPTNVSGCSQLYTNGAGDPTTGFGKGITTYDVCRVAPTAPSTIFPVTLSAPANIFIATLPAVAGLDSIQLKAGNSIFFNDILAAGGSVPQISTTSETFTSADGNTVTIKTDQSGNLIGAPGLRQVPQANTRFCFPNTGYTPAPNEFPTSTNWTCISIDFATNKAQIKSPGEDPWVYIGGTWILY
jgi:hypothetical protein